MGRDGFGDAEVDHLRHRLPVLLGYEHVGWFEVAVDDALLMGMLHCRADFSHQPEPGRHVEKPEVTILCQGFTGDQFHHKVGTACPGSPGIKDACDPRMIHHRQGLALLIESCQDFPRIHARLDDLQRHHTVDRFFLLRLPHRAESALPDDLQQLIVPDHRARLLPVNKVGWAGHGCGTSAGYQRGCALEEGIGGGIIFQHAIQSPAQFRVIAAGFVEKSGTFRTFVPFQRFKKEGVTPRDLCLAHEWMVLKEIAAQTRGCGIMKSHRLNTLTLQN